MDIETSAGEDSLSLEEYVRAIDDGGFDLTRHEDLIASAPLLQKLANNKTFLIERLFYELRNQLRFQAGNLYAPEVLLVHSTRDYFIRANIWKPISAAEEAIPGYQYDVCHDHNFDILTVGYLGLGYSCRSYRYERTAYEGRLGEVVELADEGVFSLTKGRVALYRAKEDVHIQLPPGQISVSLNLIPRGPVQNEMQFQFDEGSGMICRYLNFSGLEAAVRIADVIRSRECADALARIGNGHPSARVRALALAAQIHIEDDRADQILVDVAAHQSEMVKHLVGLELASYGSTMRSVASSPTGT
ncbi:hypothetical protein AB0F91_42905 [Amycolatopsis sp. NPDC023774]|uniref:hypothetical protein n=1 Tax=Amycolatopsis sp. NPDC023774 TaxID=3155015 RepID=UPI0033D174D9